MNTKPRYIKHKHIDKNKWDNCIDQSFNKLPYAKSWYLDLISPNWDAIIYGDYDMVMPLTHRKKFGIPYISKPVLCQQLGVFSTLHESEFYVDDFIHAIPKKFVLIDMNINESNKLRSAKAIISKKTNQTLPLSKTYLEIQSIYKKQLRKNIRNFESSIQDFTIEECTPEHLIRNKVKMLTKKSVFHSKQEIRLMLKTLDVLKKENTFETYAVSDQKQNLQSGIGFCCIDNTVFIISFTTEHGKKSNANSYLLDNFIKKHAGSNLMIDFMGSSLPGVHYWNDSFGANESDFINIKIKRLPLQ